MVDTQGFLIRVVAHAANILDRVGAELVLSKLKGYVECLKKVLADGAYDGDIQDWVQAELGCPLEIVKGILIPHTSRRHHPQRWVVERTFAWLGLHRRLSRDYEALPVVSESFVCLAAINLLLHRLHPEC